MGLTKFVKWDPKMKFKDPLKKETKKELKEVPNWMSSAKKQATSLTEAFEIQRVGAILKCSGNQVIILE